MRVEERKQGGGLLREEHQRRRDGSLSVNAEIGRDGGRIGTRALLDIQLELVERVVVVVEEGV